MSDRRPNVVVRLALVRVKAIAIQTTTAGDVWNCSANTGKATVTTLLASAALTAPAHRSTAAAVTARRSYFKALAPVRGEGPIGRCPDLASLPSAAFAEPTRPGWSSYRPVSPEAGPRRRLFECRRQSTRGHG